MYFPLVEGVQCLPSRDVSGQEVSWMCHFYHNNNPCHLIKHKWIPRRKEFAGIAKE